MSEESKPCPFCGEQVFTPLVASLDDGYTRCISCGAKMQRSRWQTRPIEDALDNRIAELTECIGSQMADVYTLKARVAELSQTVGLITTLKPTMVMDVDHPLDMAKEVVEHVTARIAKLEAENEKIDYFFRILRTFCIFAHWDNPDTEDEFNEFDKEICKYLSEYPEVQE